MTTPKTFHVICGTHWDREWRFTAEQSLLRLAELVDELLDVLESNPNYRCFLLDGGTVILEDYLSIRPENTERLHQQIRAGRVQSVMWYTLPEMSSVAPESLIRNLLMGKRLGASHGGGLINAGYTATSYGQISQLAQIYAGFGIKSALSYRGTNKHQVPPICKLESPDGTQIFHLRCFDEVTRTNWFFFPHYLLVLGKSPRDLGTKWEPDEWPVHMADAGLYETAFQMKNESEDYDSDPGQVRQAMRMLGAQAEPQMVNRQLLALDMEDNAVPYRKLPDLIATCNAAQSEYHILQSSVDDYVNACLDGLDTDRLPVLKGEMRYTLIESGFNGLLGATHSSRMDLKLANDLAERELIAVGEPLSAMSSLLGGKYETALLDRAWLHLLKNHAHDSICGAAIAQAHLDNPFRYRATVSLARECARKACEDIWCRLDTAGTFEKNDLTLTFFNTLPVARTRIESVILDTPRPNFGSFKVETCTGVGPIIEGFEPDKMLTFQYFDILDEQGNKVPHTILEREDIDMEVERKLDANAAVYDILRNRLLMEVTLPPMGYRTYAVRQRLREYNTNPQPNGERGLIAGYAGTLENEFLVVTINSNGSLNLKNKETGQSFSGLHVFTDDASTGNAHKHKGTLRDFAVTTLCGSARLSLRENTPLRATWQINCELQVPERAENNSKDRSSNAVVLPISTSVTLRKGSRILEFKSVIDNRARDHRLRVLFPTDIRTDHVFADSAFDVVRRNILWNDVKDNMEEHHPFQPMKRFVTVSDGRAGFSLMSKGLGEYEVMDDARRTLAVTLLRTNRAYMKANRGQMTPEELAENIGHHCPGRLEYEYAILAHNGGWQEGGVPMAANDYRTPVRIIQGVSKTGDLPATASLVMIGASHALEVSAFYKTTDGYILRIWNTTRETVSSPVHFGTPIKSAEVISLDEERVQRNLPVSNNSFRVELGGAGILSLLVTTELQRMRASSH